MYCKHCGTALPDDIRFCTGCGTQTGNPPDSRPPAGVGRVGYSERIHDPAFARYLKHTSRWSALFSMILAIAAPIGFYSYGETSREMENPQALFIGLSIGGLFLLIPPYSIIARKRSKTFVAADGSRVDGSFAKTQNALYQKADGTAKIAIRYFPAIPRINAPEKNTRLSLRQPVLIGTGVVLLMLVKRKHGAK